MVPDLFPACLTHSWYSLNNFWGKTKRPVILEAKSAGNKMTQVTKNESTKLLINVGY